MFRGRVMVRETISMVFDFPLCEAVWFGMAGGEKPLKWLPFFPARIVNRGAADPQPEGWGE